MSTARVRRSASPLQIPVRIIQLLVGILFIISGLVKANDPVGLGYKMQEFFELWISALKEGHFFARNILVSLLEFWNNHSLFLSVLMITLEIVTGIALLIGWMKKFILWLLLLLIIFFTFLTGYAYLSGKFTNCGCFGDCLPITPYASFLKDLVLLALIIILLLGQKFIQPVLSARFRAITLVAALGLSLLFQWYVLNYLPVADCLPFKKGNNIAEQMKPPPGSIPDSTASRFIYEKDGKRYEWAPDQLPADYETYKFIDRIDKLVRKGNAEPRIKGFSLMGSQDSVQVDSTQVVLEQPRAVLGFGLDTMNRSWLNHFSQLVTTARKKNIPVYFASSEPDDFRQLFMRNNIPVQVFPCDFTVIRTAARTNPAVYILKSGTITDKYSYRNIDKATGQINKL